jgi:hypothetical protein
MDISESFEYEEISSQNKNISMKETKESMRRQAIAFYLMIFTILGSTFGILMMAKLS